MDKALEVVTLDAFMEEMIEKAPPPHAVTWHEIYEEYVEKMEANQSEPIGNRSFKDKYDKAVKAGLLFSMVYKGITYFWGKEPE